MGSCYSRGEVKPPLGTGMVVMGFRSFQIKAFMLYHKKQAYYFVCPGNISSPHIPLGICTPPYVKPVDLT